MDYLSSTEACRIDGFIYIKSTPSVNLERIKMRDRPGEDQIGIGYLRGTMLY